MSAKRELDVTPPTDIVPGEAVALENVGLLQSLDGRCRSVYATVDFWKSPTCYREEGQRRGHAPFRAVGGGSKATDTLCGLGVSVPRVNGLTSSP
jgi:hypothetical protein